LTYKKQARSFKRISQNPHHFKQRTQKKYEKKTDYLFENCDHELHIL